MKKICMILTLAFVSISASASFVISPGISYIDRKQDASTPGAINSSSNETRADIRVGYILPMGLYLGGMYSHIGSDNNAIDSSGNLIGPSVGYYSLMGFYTMLTYHITGEVGDANKYSGGKGPQIDVGWVFPLTANFSLGPQLTYRSIEFDKLESGGVTVDTDFKDTTIAPYLSLWFMF